MGEPQVQTSKSSLDFSNEFYQNTPNSKLINQILKLNKSSKNPLLAMLYGSQKKQSDLDIFLIYDIPVEKNIFINNYDLNQIEINNFYFKLFNRDIEYTEPLLTGNYFFGDKKILKQSKDFLQNKNPEKEIYDYLGKRSIETFLQAENFYSSGKNDLFNKLAISGESLSSVKDKIFKNNFNFDSEIINKSLSILTYSLSYLASIKRYQNGERTITINQILNNPINDIEKQFFSLRDYFKSCSKGEKKLSFNKIDTYFNETKFLLRRNI